MKNFAAIVFGGALVIAAFLFVAHPGTAGDGTPFGSNATLSGNQTCTNTSVNATSTAGGTVVLVQNSARAYAKITNDHSSKVYYVRGATAATSGTPIAAAGSVEWGDPLYPYWGTVAVQSSSGTAPISVIECVTKNVY